MIESIRTYYTLEDIPKQFISSSNTQSNKHLNGQDNNDILFIMLLTMFLMEDENPILTNDFFEKLFAFLS